VRNVTAQICGDPPPQRSALDGYKHIGTIDGGHRLYSEEERKERKYKANRIRGRTKLCEGVEE
jgi:hypothetical protein